MFRNYLLVAYRNLLKYKGFTLANIFGLAIGFAVCLLLGSYILSEFRVNHGLLNSERQYIIESEWKEAGLGVPMTTYAPMARALATQYPQLVANYYRFHAAAAVVKVGDDSFRESIQIGDSGFHQMYGFALLHGNPDKAGLAPDGAVITAQAAVKYFGTTDAINERIRVETSSGGDYKEYRVTGVLAETGFNSITHMLGQEYHVYLPGEDTGRFNADLESWESVYIVNMLELQEGVDPARLQKPIAQLISDHAPEAYRDKLTPKLTLLTDYHLSQNGALESLLRTLTLIAIFVLLMAVVNFWSSQIGLASRRLKEVGLRKVLGGVKVQIAKQFLTESLLQCGLAMVLALTIYQLGQPVFEQFIGRSIFHLSAFSTDLWVAIFISLLLISLLSGAYPMLVTNWVPLSAALRNNVQSATRLYRRGLAPRKILSTIQLTLAVFVLLCTWVVSSQVTYFFDADLGYDKDRLVVLTLPRDWSQEGYQRIESFKKRIMQLSTVKGASVSFEIPNGNFGNRFNFKAEGTSPDVEVGMPFFKVDEHYFDTYGVEILEGRAMDSTRNDREVVINQAAVESFGWDAPIGKQIWNDPEFRYKVVGVVEDFHIAKMSDVREPVVFTHPANWFYAYRYLNIHLPRGQLVEGVAQIKEEWQASFIDNPFDYEFMDQKLAHIYQAELQLKHSSRVASLLVIVILVLGVINMTALSLTFRTKEIGIRKVLGANLAELYQLFVKDYLITVAMASLVGVPTAYWLLHTWLNNFAYRTTIAWWVWAVPPLIVSLVILLLIIGQTTRVCTRNPTDSLRYD